MPTALWAFVDPQKTAHPGPAALLFAGAFEIVDNSLTSYNPPP
jgi:hypothetical protein